MRAWFYYRTDLPLILAYQHPAGKVLENFSGGQ